MFASTRFRGCTILGGQKLRQHRSHRDQYMEQKEKDKKTKTKDAQVLCGMHLGVI